MQRTTSSRSKNFHISRQLSHPTPLYQPTSQNQLGIFSPPYQVLPKFCPRSSSLESKELMLSKGDTTMYTFLTGNPVRPFPFILRFPINSNTISRSQTYTSVGCVLYCQRHTDLNIPTPAIYAYSCAHGSEFIAMEYIDGDGLSEVWMDLP